METAKILQAWSAIQAEICITTPNYLHGGVNRVRREKIIGKFQNPETEPSAFILSLKAGGVGLTLTKANHVFHFDRWWSRLVGEERGRG